MTFVSQTNYQFRTQDISSLIASLEENRQIIENNYDNQITAETIISSNSSSNNSYKTRPAQSSKVENDYDEDDEEFTEDFEFYEGPEDEYTDIDEDEVFSETQQNNYTTEEKETNHSDTYNTISKSYEDLKENKKSSNQYVSIESDVSDRKAADNSTVIHKHKEDFRDNFIAIESDAKRYIIWLAGISAVVALIICIFFVNVYHNQVDDKNSLYDDTNLEIVWQIQSENSSYESSEYSAVSSNFVESDVESNNTESFMTDSDEFYDDYFYVGMKKDDAVKAAEEEGRKVIKLFYRFYDDYDKGYVTNEIIDKNDVTLYVSLGSKKYTDLKDAKKNKTTVKYNGVEIDVSDLFYFSEYMYQKKDKYYGCLDGSVHDFIRFHKYDTRMDHLTKEFLDEDNASMYENYSGVKTYQKYKIDGYDVIACSYTADDSDGEHFLENRYFILYDDTSVQISFVDYSGKYTDYLEEAAQSIRVVK